jgi:ribosome-binding factor A
MDTTRQLKYARLIQKELGDIFQKDGKSFYGSAFVTLTMVRVTPDLSIARAYVSVFKDNKEEILRKLESHKSEIRKRLGDRIRNQARIIPDLEFFIDDSLDYAEKMDKIMRDIHIPPASEQD